MTFFTNEEVMRLMADCITHHQPLSDLEIVIRTGINLNIPVHKGLRPLHYAAFENSLPVAELLIDKGALVNIGDDIGYTPLHLAAKHGYRRMVKLLISKGAVVNFLGETLTGSEVQDTYLQDSCTLAELTVCPLNLALENDHPECAKILLDNGADANQKYFLGHEINLIPLENIKCIEVMLQNGADPNVYNRCGLTVLHKAAKTGVADVVRLLATYGADLDKPCGERLEQKRAIHYAVLSGNLEVLQALLEGGASTKRPPNFPSSALDYAVALDKLEVCRLLLAFGADPNELNEDFCTPLQVACSTPDMLNQKAIIEVLLENGADPNYARETHSFICPSLTPAVEYLAYNHVYDPSIFKLLFKHGAEINMTRPTRRFTIIDKCGILSQARKLRNDEPLLDIFMEVAGSFNKDDIDFDRSGLTEKQRELLLHEAQIPRSLSHLARLAVRARIPPPKLCKINTLPVPDFFKRFLTFDFDRRQAEAQEE